MEKLHTSKGPRILMVGYSGANNTGAEALLQADINDVRAVLGPWAHITVPTLNEANLRRYVHESPTLKIAPMPTLYFGAIRRMVKECDLVLLVEGSTYMDTWGSPLLWMFLWATHCAAVMGKPSLAYAVDAGSLSPANRKRVRRVASRTGLIVTRNQAAAQRLRGMGVTAPIETTADNAFTFQPREADRTWLSSEWPRSAAGVVGFAMVDFSLFPAVMRPWGPRKQCYKWPYYLSCSPERTQSSRMLARGYASLADRVVERSGKAVAFLCMEQLDEALAAQTLRFMRHPESARMFSARQYDASQMTSLLRDLDLLVTSRFHAAVLSLAAGVPQVAVGHDTRLATLYHDLGLSEKWLIDLRSTEEPVWKISKKKLFNGLQHRMDLLLSDPGLQKDILKKGYREHLGRARQNRRLLTDFVAKKFGDVNRTFKQTDDLNAALMSQGGALCAA
jgi:polysaccharide pyruvyl transferase WcaK-like protein